MLVGGGLFLVRGSLRGRNNTSSNKSKNNFSLEKVAAETRHVAFQVKLPKNDFNTNFRIKSERMSTD